MKAWYFAPSNERLSYEDNRTIKVGHMHTVKCRPILCTQGLHGSVNVLDALQYAKSSILYLVDITRHIDVGADKICGQRRKYIARIDTTVILREFARKQALINIEKIKPYTNKYDLIVDYLSTGKESIRDAAQSAAWSAAQYAAQSAAQSAAWSAAQYAANTMLTEMIEKKLFSTPKK